MGDIEGLIGIAAGIFAIVIRGTNKGTSITTTPSGFIQQPDGSLFNPSTGEIIPAGWTPAPPPPSPIETGPFKVQINFPYTAPYIYSFPTREEAEAAIAYWVARGGTATRLYT